MRCLAITCSALLLTPAIGLAQHTHRSSTATDAFVAAAAQASLAFQDRNAAIRAGYRQVGLSFPSMGEHWIQPRLLIGGTVDSTRPSVLAYVMVQGRPELAGVGWALVVDSSRTVPNEPGPFWHRHDGTLGAASFSGIHGGHGPSVAVLHVWLNVPNGAGQFETDNWALPWVAAGFSPPAHPDLDAARALSLVSDGAEYWEEWMRFRDQDPVVLIPASDSVKALVGHHYPADRLEPLLSALWRHWAGRLRLPHGQMEGH